MKRPYGTMKRFTRLKKLQVRRAACVQHVVRRFTHSPGLCVCDASEHKQLLKTAQLELKKSKRKDYYKVLGVGKNATEDEIKKAYRKRALMHHPGVKHMADVAAVDCF